MACHLAGTPSHYLNQCWYIVNWTLGHFSEILIQTYIFSFKNFKMHLKMASEKYGVWKMVSILSQPQCVDMNKVFMLVYSRSVTRPEMDQNWLLLPALWRFWHRVVLANYGVKKTTWEYVLGRCRNNFGSLLAVHCQPNVASTLGWRRPTTSAQHRFNVSHNSGE